MHETNNRMPTEPAAETDSSPGATAEDAPAPGSRKRKIIRYAAAVGLALLLLRMVFIGGYIRPIRTSGASMAPTVLGEHFAITCPECSWRYAFNSQKALDRSPICPNCGAVGVKDADQSPLPGERLLVDRLPYWYGDPQRFDLAALRATDNDDWLIKRVIGLPEEVIEIRHGDVFANGEIVRKSLAELKSMAVPVYDDQFRSPATEPRWRSDGARADGPGWLRSADGYHADATGDASLPWLQYHHAACYRTPLPRDEPTPVHDNHGYNQELSRSLHPVGDLLLTCQVVLNASATARFTLHDGYRLYQLEISARNQRLRLLEDEVQVAEATTRRFQPDYPFKLEWAACDRRIIAAIGGETVLSFDTTIEEQARQGSPTPLAIHASGGSIALGQLQLVRDLYHLHPQGLDAPWKAERPLGKNEYFLLGDNGPASHDSRHWPVGSVTAERFIGKAYVIYRHSSRE